MQRKLIVERGNEHIASVYEGLLLGVNNSPEKGRDLRQTRRLIRGIESVSVPTEEAFPGSKTRQRVAKEGELLLEQVDLDMLVKLIEGVPWPGIDVCRMADAIDWLLASPTTGK